MKEIKMMFIRKKKVKLNKKIIMKKNKDNPNNSLTKLPKDKITIKVDIIGKISIRFNQKVIMKII